MATALTVLVACLLDHWLGEPKKYHPLVQFGDWANRLETRINTRASSQCFQLLCVGTIAVFCLVIPCVLAAILLSRIPVFGQLLACFGLYLAIGRRSLIEHAEAVKNALQDENMALARINLSRMVSRDTRHSNPQEISAGAIESVLENGNDALFAAIFWFIVAGLPGVVLYRLSNTLDAMWGYKNQRFNCFGRFAARLDDVLNWVPARLTAFGYSLVGQTKPGIQCWRDQAPDWSSPNAGPVMASGAGALSIRVGGPARYRSRQINRPVLGCGAPASTKDIDRSVHLVTQCLLLWCTVILVGDWYID